MLFHGIANYIPAYGTSGKITIKLNNYIDTLNTKRTLMEARYSTNPGNESEGIRLLRKILADADSLNLLKKSSDFDRYFDILQYNKNDLEHIFNPNNTAVSRRGLFIRNTKYACDEFLIPVHCNNYLQDLPFDKGWEAWKQVRALRILDINTDELTINSYMDQIVFKQDNPSYCVISIDVVALVLQYINYCQVTAERLRLSVPEYLHRYVMIGLLEDLQSLWLRSQYVKFISQPLTLGHQKFNITEMSKDNMYGFIGVEYPQAMNEIIEYTRNCKMGSITPATLLASLPLTHLHISDYIHKLTALTEIEDSRQNKWIIYLRDIKWIDIIYRIYKLNPNFIRYKNFTNMLKRDIPLIANTKFWNSCHSVSVRNYIESDILSRLE